MLNNHLGDVIHVVWYIHTVLTTFCSACMESRTEQLMAL